MANSNYRRRLSRISNLESLEDRRVLATLAGTVFEDVSDNKVLDDSDPRIGGVVLFLDDNNNGVLDQSGFGMDPDEFENGQVLNRARQTLFPSGTGTDNEPSFQIVSAQNLGRASTGQRVFGYDDTTDWVNGKRLRFDFTLPVDSASIDVIGSSGITNANVRFEAYNEDGVLLDSASRNGIAAGEARRLDIARAGEVKDISYVVAYVSSVSGSVTFDNLRADDAGSEIATLTSDTGFYRFFNLPAGEITVAQETPNGYDQTAPTSSQVVNIFGGLGIVSRNFGNRTASINGFLFEDQGIVGVYEVAVDDALQGASVYLDSNGNGIPDPNTVDVFPDVFLDDQVLDFVSSFIELSTANADNVPGGANVIAAVDPVASPDGKIFARSGDAAWTNDQRFRADFATPANSVSIRFTGGTDAGEERGTLIAYSSTGVAIATENTRLLGRGESQTMTIQRSGFDIDHIVAYTGVTAGDSDGSGRLTDLRTVMVKEPVAVSGEDGFYSFKPLASGTYQVRALPSASQPQSFPAASVQMVTVDVGDSEEDIDFGFEPNNEPPVAKSDFVRTTEDFPVSVGVLVNDEDPDGQINEGSVTISQNPLNGTASVTTDGFITYTPNADFFGRDSLLYTVRDDEGAISNTAVVTIDVDPANDAPVAVDDTASLLAEESTIINVLGNDSDIDSAINPASVTIVTTSSNGTVTVGPAGLVSYTSTNAIDDSFTYTIEDEEGSVSNVATVTITKLAAGVPPVAVADSATTLEGTAQSINVTSNDTDADGTIDSGSVFIVGMPANGSVQVGAAGFVTYQPNLGFVGTDTFSYRVRDNSGLVSNAADVSISMTERDFPYQNPIDNFDVSADGDVSPRDVLLVINEINEPEISDPATGQIIVTLAAGERPTAYLDVDGNGLITPRDVLGVITQLNNQASSAAGEPIDTAVIDAAVASLFESQFDAMDDDDDDWV